MNGLKDKNRKVVVTVVGQVDVGKTTLINKVLGANYGAVSPVPGWTKNVEIYNFAEDAVIADTPGLEDMNKRNAEKTIKFCENSDVLIYMFNATVGITDSQRDSFKRLYMRARPTLAILNKVDAEKDWRKVMSHSIAVLDFDGFVGISAETGYNTNKILNWLITTLKNSRRRLLIEKILRPKIVSIIKRKVKNPDLAKAIEYYLKQNPISKWLPGDIQNIEEAENLLIGKLKKVQHD